MKFRHQILYFFTFLAAGLLTLNAAVAKGPSAKVTVTNANPNSALQGDPLNVEISGSGFDGGSTVKFLVTGTKDDRQISVDQESVHSSADGTLLTVDIVVSGGATVTDYDIEVKSSSGRRGKGTTLFAVKQNSGGGNSEKGFKVKVTFDDLTGDTIKSDGNPAYFEFDGSGVGTSMPVEFSPPGQFAMWLKLAAIRHLFIDFGVAVDCAGAADPGTLACVADKADDSTFTDPVPCPFPSGERFDDQGSPTGTQCSGYKLVSLGFRHSVDEFGAEDEYMLGMVNDVTFDGEGDNIEIDFREESKKDDDLRLRFDANCLGLGKGDFLKITAWDSIVGDGILNDHWRIDTIETDAEGNIDTTTKTACLTRKGNGKREDLVGLFDMQFGYTICILANQDPASAADGACLGEP